MSITKELASMDTRTKKQLSETDIISKFIMPAVEKAGWDSMTQIRQEVKLRDGKVIVRGQLGVRKTVKSADIVLYHKPNIPLAVIEAKANKHELGKGMQQGLDYARLLDVPFVFASNGDGFIFHDKTAPDNGGALETEISLDELPSPLTLCKSSALIKAMPTRNYPISPKTIMTMVAAKRRVIIKLFLTDMAVH